MRYLRRPGVLTIVVAASALLITRSVPIADEPRDAGSALALADLASGIIQCREHPCLGDTMMDVRKLLEDSVVFDGTFYYSDLAIAYPSARGPLQGVVEWDFDDGLDYISMKLTDIRVPREVLFAELERALPGCEISGDEEGDDASGDGDDIPSTEWSCTATIPGHPDVEVAVYLAPGLAIFELD